MHYQSIQDKRVPLWTDSLSRDWGMGRLSGWNRGSVEASEECPVAQVWHPPLAPIPPVRFNLTEPVTTSEETDSVFDPSTLLRVNGGDEEWRITPTIACGQADVVAGSSEGLSRRVSGGTPWNSSRSATTLYISSSISRTGGSAVPLVMSSSHPETSRSEASRVSGGCRPE